MVKWSDYCITRDFSLSYLTVPFISLQYNINYSRLVGVTIARSPHPNMAPTLSSVVSQRLPSYSLERLFVYLSRTYHSYTSKIGWCFYIRLLVVSLSQIRICFFLIWCETECKSYSGIILNVKVFSFILSIVWVFVPLEIIYTCMS